MNISHNRALLILHSVNRKSNTVIEAPADVQSFFERLKVSQPIPYTIDAFKGLPKAAQDDLKDCGGYIAGTSINGRRRWEDIQTRSALVIDADNLSTGDLDVLIQSVQELGCCSCIYSTAKHSPRAPRLRIVIPFAEDISAELYAPVVRLLCSKIQPNMTWFDPTTDEASRIMFYASHCQDITPVYIVNDKPLLDAKSFLEKELPTWEDPATWPRFARETTPEQLSNKEKQKDPKTKKKIVGAFCRTYDVYRAMAELIPGVYDPCDSGENRYTYTNGSTTGGAIVYDNGNFLFSHHATDPCGGKLVNAFDLVRLHKFGSMDADAAPGTPTNKLPSYQEMVKFAVADPEVLLELDRERAEGRPHEFDGLTQEDPDAWRLKLERNERGGVLPTIGNILLILDNDPELRGKFALNEFAGRGEVLGPLPWNNAESRRLWSDTDSNGLYWFLEARYQITKRQNIDSALDLHAAQHRFNEVADYLNSLEWDGTPRLDTLFIDYLGAEDTPYTRAVCRKAFSAAVARAIEPGTKFDYMLILCGPQGIGKSTLLDKMSRGWFNDSIRTFEGKEASELLPGVWLVEVAELDAFRRTDVSRIKQFLSLRADRYRAAYGRHMKEFPRRCVFFGTSNQADFLQDTTGNRRFWPVDVGINPHPKTVWRDLSDDTINQIWAEAKARWQIGEQLYLTGEVEKMAQEMQEQHRDADPNEQLIQEFSLKLIPVDWSKWPLQRRLDYWDGGIIGDVKLTERCVICPLEVWVELFHNPINKHTAADIKQIKEVLNRSPDWEKAKAAVYCGAPYGTQRAYRRKHRI